MKFPQNTGLVVEFAFLKLQGFIYLQPSKIHISVFTKVTNENTESTIRPFIQVISSTRKRLSCHRLLHFLPLSLKTLVAF